MILCTSQTASLSSIIFFPNQVESTTSTKMNKMRTNKNRERETEDGNYGVWESGLLCVDGNGTDRGMKARGVREH